MYIIFLMKTIILPGYSLKNKAWAIETAINLGLEVGKSVWAWQHWDDPETRFNFEIETAKIIKTNNEPVNIIAKSVGTVVASNIVLKNKGLVNRLILCGVPVNDIDDREINIITSVLKQFDRKNVLCFQNTSDPHGTFDQIKKVFGASEIDIALVEKDRPDHEYPYYKEFQDFLTKKEEI